MRSESAPEAAEETAGGRRQAFSPVALVTCLAGLLITAALAWTAMEIYERNEQRLLNVRVRELGLVLTSNAPVFETPMAGAAELADATNGNAQRFRALMAPYVGTGVGKFTSISLWSLRGAQPTPTVVLGEQPALAELPARARSFFAHAGKTSSMSVIGLLERARPRLGYGDAARGGGGSAVYLERLLPTDRRSLRESNSAFLDLNYALYLGRHRNPHDLTLTNIQHFPIEGQQASTVVPFGDNALTVVVTPKGSLGGDFFRDLPWIIAGIGTLLTIAAAMLAERLVRRRRHAEELAGALDHVAAENAQMYVEQRGIAQTLQHALLPDALPSLDGLQASARYVPAPGLEVGGDWYDLIALDDRRALLVIGDVSGHGIAAATTMALLRHTTLAYAAQQASPAAVLASLSDFVNGRTHNYFATVLCGLIDLDSNRVTIASAGHLPPLLIGAQSSFVELEIGVPIGAPRREGYRESTVRMAPGSILVAFTDGLIERRGELIDVGLERLRARAGSTAGDGLEDRIQRLVGDLYPDEQRDDAAILMIRWPG